MLFSCKKPTVFLQETHTLTEDNKIIGRRWQGNIYAATFTSQARGVMILDKSVPYQFSNVIKDKSGGYLIIQGSLFSVNLNLVNIYGPNTDEPDFFLQTYFLHLHLSQEDT